MNRTDLEILRYLRTLEYNAGAEMPEIAKEIISSQFWLSLVAVFFYMFILFIMYGVLEESFEENPDLIEKEKLTWEFVAIIAFGVAIWKLIDNIHEILVICISPNLYIFEYIQELSNSIN